MFRILKLTDLEFHGILNPKMRETTLQPKFIRPFSKGQITLPKDYREHLRIDENSWLRISLLDDQILIQPIKNQLSRRIKAKLNLRDYKKVLLKIKGNWVNKAEYKKTREEIEKRLFRNEKNFT